MQKKHTNETHVLPKVANDLLGSMITNDTHATAQHRRSTFHDFHERRFDETHGGSLSHALFAFGAFDGEAVCAEGLSEVGCLVAPLAGDVGLSSPPSFSLLDIFAPEALAGGARMGLETQGYRSGKRAESSTAAPFALSRSRRLTGNQYARPSAASHGYGGEPSVASDVIVRIVS